MNQADSGDCCLPYDDASTAPALTTRRRVLQALAGAGVGTVVFHRAVAALAQESTDVSPEMIREAEWIAGVELTDEQRKQAAGSVNRALRDYEALRAVRLDNSVPPAVSFHPALSLPLNSDQRRGAVAISEAAPPSRPDSPEALAYLPIAELAPLIRSRQVSSTELTQLYLDRLRRYDPLLKCVVSLTEELALRQAEQADREIAAGRYRGPLHGIPWGAKDLIAYPGYKTTWGATPFKDQKLDVKATVAKRLEEAGAVLVAKLSLGALAMGDLWFGGRTRNPWNPQEGSSGSSAGSAAATAAGLVGFAIGSETHGSIVSPCRRCGVSGLRPTFGRVSRHGCMTLAWSMDKLGPIARCVEDCALVFGAIHGWDGFDPSAVDQPFTWPCSRDLRSLKIGYVKSETETVARPELDVLRGLGVNLVPIELPQEYPRKMLQTVLDTEAAAVFDELTRSDVTEGLNSWPRTFRSAQFVPAIEYLRAQRVRTLLMREMEGVMSRVDLYVGGDDMTLTNFTGHPTVVLPNGLRERDGAEVPTAITFTGRLYGESEVLAVAHAYQLATGYHLRRPPLGSGE